MDADKRADVEYPVLWYRRGRNPRSSDPTGSVVRKGKDTEMKQEELDTMYRDFLGGSVPISYMGDLPSFRQGAAEFGNFIKDRVELVKAGEPPKEE
jgi:hypothetical protein